MSLKFALPMVLTAACLTLGTGRALAYTETGDAGDLPATAQAITGVAGVTYTTIQGTTTATAGIFDSDMYALTIASPVYFTASNTSFAPGSNNFDSQIALFDATFKGVLANDDAAGGGSQSSLSTGTSFFLTPGTYYLLISGSGRYAADATGAAIFPNFTDGTTDPTGTYAPTATAGVITQYTGNSNEGGNYLITLSTLPAVVPEPSSLAALAAGLGGLVLTFRRRLSK